MIRTTAWRAALAGVALLVIAQILYVGVLSEIRNHELLRLTLIGSNAFSACIVAYLSPSRKLLMGMSMAFYGAVIGVLSAMVYDYFGFQVDRIGGPLTSFFILFAHYAAMSLAGSAVGIMLSRQAPGHS